MICLRQARACFGAQHSPNIWRMRLSLAQLGIGESSGNPVILRISKIVSGLAELYTGSPLAS